MLKRLRGAITAIGATTSPLHLSFSSNGQLAYSAQTEIRNLQRLVQSNSHNGSQSRFDYTGFDAAMSPDPSPDGEWLAALVDGPATTHLRHAY